MSKEILINAESLQTAVAIVNDGRLEEYYIERPQQKSIVGNIYKGRVLEIVPSLNAAFVDIGLEKKGFLYLQEELATNLEFDDEHKHYLSQSLKKNDEILVQVTKEPFGTKGPRLSTHISIPGRYLVLMPLDRHVGISRRIEDGKERLRLKRIMQDLKLPSDVGFIVRTASLDKTPQQLRLDAHFLLKLWSRIKKASHYKKPPSLIYEDYDITLRVIRDSFTEDVDKVIVDSKKHYYQIYRFVRTFLKHLANRIEFYRGDDLFLEKGIEPQINAIFGNKVYFKSGAYIVIEPTEGLVVIDVNSGSFTKRCSLEEAAFRINLEATSEIVRQLRLRDLGGIIVVDFIDMGKEEHRQKVFNALKEALRSDRAHYDILGISRFGLVEMTRERIHKTVEAMTFASCPYCQGKGKVKSNLTMAIYAIKELKRYIKSHRFLKVVKLSLNAAVSELLLKDREIIKSLENRFRIHIEVIPNPALHVEEIKISD